MKDPLAESGSLAVDGGAVRYTGAYGVLWTVAVSEVVAVAEYTTADGPAVDDHFLVFVRGDGELFTASFYAEGRDTALAALGAILGTTLRTGLANSTEWASRVLWPPELEGAPGFELTPRPGRGFAGPILTRLGLTGATISVGPQIRALLRHEGGHPA